MFALSSDTFLDILGDLELSHEEGADRLLFCYTDHCDCSSLFFGVFPRFASRAATPTFCWLRQRFHEWQNLRLRD